MFIYEGGMPIARHYNSKAFRAVITDKSESLQNMMETKCIQSNIHKHDNTIIQFHFN